MIDKIIFLGTNGWYDDNETGHTLSVLIKCNDYDIILDAGSGFSQIDRYYKEIGQHKTVYLFLSHLHLDHIIGLHSLAKYSFFKGLSILSTKENLVNLKKILRFPYTVNMDMLKYNVKFMEVYKFSKKLPFGLKVLPVKHTAPTIAAKFFIGNNMLSFITDTGICDNSYLIAKNSDILITECAHRVDEKNDEWPHMNPEEAAGLAVKANIKKLILTHFDPSRYTSKKSRLEAEIKAKEVFKETYSSFDGMIIKMKKEV